MENNINGNQVNNMKIAENIPNKKDYDFRNIALTAVGLFIILAVVSGGTFAYYAFNQTDSNTITGTAASAAGLNMTVTKMSTDANGVLVPQLNSTLNKAIVGTSNKKCVDGNGNTVCQIYKIDLSNGSTASFSYDIKISFSGGTFTNLKWATITSADYSATSYSNITVPTALNANSTQQSAGTGTLAASTGTASHYIVVWINETNSVQNSIDYGTFTGTVTLNDNNGQAYITSTFTA